MKVNLYDFDGTIYDGDSSVDFYLFCLKYSKKSLLQLPSIFIKLILYKLGKITKTKFKESVFSFLKNIKDVDKVVEEFWKNNNCKIKAFYQEKKHDHDIIISASPEFLLEPIAKELKVVDLIASRVDKKTGKFMGENCHDVEKVRRLKEKYPQVDVEEVYSDSYSDKPIMELGKNSYLVRKNKIKKID